MRDSGIDGLGEALAAAEAAPPVESVDVIAAALRRQFGARSVSFLITDFTGSSVVRLGAAGDIDLDRPADAIGVAGTVYEQMIRTQQPHVERVGDGAWTRVIAPVTNRGDAIGLLELYLPHHPGPDTLDKIRHSAHALAYIVIANRPFTDLYQWGRRTSPLGLAAEIQHRLLPASLACEAAQFAVAGALEPAEFVGGDTAGSYSSRRRARISAPASPTSRRWVCARRTHTARPLRPTTDTEDGDDRPGFLRRPGPAGVRRARDGLKPRLPG